MRMTDGEGRLLERHESPAAITAFHQEVSRDHTGDADFDQDAMAGISRVFEEWKVKNNAPGEWEEPPSKEEIRKALAACPNGRAAGKDDLPYEAFSAGGEVAIDMLHSLFAVSYTEEVHPREWDTGLINLLYKKGCPHDPKNYRAVTLLSTAAKVYEGVLLGRIQQVLTETQFLSPTQGGFRKGMSIPESFYTLYTTLAHRREQGLSTFVLFIDFQTAFPLANKELVWSRLAEAGVRGRLWRVMWELYADVNSAIMHADVAEWHIILIPQGLRQGAKPAPVLFSLKINDLSDYLERGGDQGLGARGVIPPIFPGAPQSHTGLFADDSVVLTPDEGALDRVIQQVQGYARTRGLVINFDKCAVMAVRPKDWIQPQGQQPRSFAGICPRTGKRLPIPEVKNFKYLGIYIDHDLTMEKNLRATRSNFWAAYAEASRMGMRQDALAMGDRALLFKSLPMAALLGNIHFMTPAQAKSFQADVNKAVRAMSVRSAQPLALAAEFGILQVEIYRLRATAKLFFALQSTAAPTTASRLYRAIQEAKQRGDVGYLRSGAGTVRPHEMHKRFKLDLEALGLLEHFTAGPKVEEMELRRESDIQERDNPTKGASKLFPYRYAWGNLVEERAREYGKELLWKEAESGEGEGSRLKAYMID